MRNERSDNRSSIQCDYCGKNGHVEKRCHLNPDNPDNRLPEKVLARLNGKAPKSAGKSGKVEIAGATVEKTTISPPNNRRSYSDSGATAHCYHDESAFIPGSLKACEPRTIMLADETSVVTKQCGDVLMPFEFANVRLTEVLHVPSLGFNLVSVGRLADKGISSHFRRHDVQLTFETKSFLLGAGHRDPATGLYMLPEPVPSTECTLSVTEEKHPELWHRRLAHIHSRALPKLHEHVDGVPVMNQLGEVCRACRLGKAHKLPFSGHFLHASAIGEIVHSDIVGPLEASYRDYYRYVCTFLDDHSRYLFIGLMQHRSDLASVFDAVSEDFRKLGGADKAPNYSRSIQELHSDGAKEYIGLQNNGGGGNENFGNFDQSFSAPYTPEHNAIAERVNRTIVEAARSLLIQAELPLCLWPYALKHVVHVRNRVPHSTIKDTPHMVMTGNRPSLKNVKVFGCTAYVLRLPRGSKFEPRALEGVLLETLKHGAHKVLVVDDTGPRIVESRHVTFDESRFPGAQSLTHYMSDEDSSDSDYDGNIVHMCDDGSVHSEAEISSDEDVEGDAPVDPDDGDPVDAEIPELNDDSDDENDDVEIDDEDDDSDLNAEDANLEPEEPQPSRYPRRNRRAPPAWFMMTSAARSTDVSITTSDEPSLHEALKSTPEERDLWQSAVQDELASLENMQTWERDDSPAAQPLPTHVVLKVKRQSNGNVERFKARIVAGGNHQTYGNDYMETYAPVVSFAMVRLFLYLALCLHMCIGQVDVKTAFLNGDLSESVWVMSPHGIPGMVSKFYRLLKAMYGLKQAHLAWHTKLCRDLKALGFEELPSAPCVFRLRGQGSGLCFILVYVDDLLILTPTMEERHKIVCKLQKLYKLRVLDNVELFLGVQLKWTQGKDGRLISLTMSQSLYTDSVVRRFEMQNCNPAVTPMVESFFSGLDLEEQVPLVDIQLYQQMIGSLLYLALRTRPDILAAVLILARFQSAPTQYCHRGVKRVLRYLRGTSKFALHYQAGETTLQAYVDADYAGDSMDRKSMSGFLVKAGDATFAWGARKQSAVALSTCEAEYYAMTMAAQELIWLGRVMSEAGLNVKEGTPLRSDNQSAITWATGERCPTGRAKHIDVRIHFIRDLVKESMIDVVYVPTEENDADFLTKPLGRVLLQGVLSRISLGTSAEEEC